MNHCHVQGARRATTALGLGVSMIASLASTIAAQRVPPVLPPVEYRAQTLDGHTIHVGDHQGLTLVNVFATWCTTCRTEFNDLEHLAREFSGRMAVVAISVDESPDEKVRQFLAGRRATFSVVHDSSGEAARIFRTVGVPESYLVGRDGRVLWHRGGELRPVIASLRQAIEAAR